MQPGDKDDGPLPDAVAILDAVIDHVAQEEAESGEPTEQDIRWSRDVRRQLQSRVAGMRRQLDQPDQLDQLDRQRPQAIEPAEPTTSMGDDSHALRALDREALLARLKPLHPPGAHPDLASLGDEELRWMLARLTRPTEGGTP